ncbi:helix-turn-helix domain-containing protein [Caldifermentibacillus hisashii]|uniref:helix-turn-helix domain-containing protein n=1 Tax=Caldifermentibacillus hisashii TaxID=996558 RepID=UPI0031358A25
MRFFSEELSKKNRIFSENREKYSAWKNELQEMNKPFFMIPTDFKHFFLKDISGGALKLFLFLGFHSKYNTGESWYTVDQAASFFGKDPRTVANWFKELEDLGLIFREQKGFKMKANTFLKPFGFKFDEMRTGEQSDYKDVLFDVEESEKIEYKPVLGLMLNYALREYTFLLVYQDGTEFPVSCFLNFDIEGMKALRVQLRRYNFPIDNYDIDKPISAAKNKKQALYNYLIKYLDEQSM